MSLYFKEFRGANFHCQQSQHASFLWQPDRVSVFSQSIKLPSKAWLQTSNLLKRQDVPDLWNANFPSKTFLRSPKSGSSCLPGPAKQKFQSFHFSGVEKLNRRRQRRKPTAGLSKFEEPSSWLSMGHFRGQSWREPGQDSSKFQNSANLSSFQKSEMNKSLCCVSAAAASCWSWTLSHRLTAFLSLFRKLTLCGFFADLWLEKINQTRIKILISGRWKTNDADADVDD